MDYFSKFPIFRSFQFSYVSWNPPQNSLLCDWWCSLEPNSHRLQGKCTWINLSQAVSGIILQNHRRLFVSIFSVKIAALGLWRGLLKEFSKLVIPSNLLISSGGINFVTPTANFCLHLLGLLHKISKNFKNKLSFKYFSLLMLFYAKKWFI